MLTLFLTPASFNEIYSKLLKEKLECLSADGTLDLSGIRIAKESPDLRSLYAGLESLTRRENQVMERIHQGKTNRQIARELNLSEKTVKAHVTASFKILGVTNRTQGALRYASLLENSRASSSTPETNSVFERSPTFSESENTTSQMP